MRRERLPVIDAARIAAAMGVLVFHAAALSGFDKRILPGGLPSPFPLGATGVSLFFVISGFCLHRAWQNRRPRLSEYAASRLTRIWPAYFVTLALSAVVAAVLHGYWSAADFATKALFLQGFVQHYALTLNGALWSMATEVQFYATLPLLVFIFARLQATWVLAATIALCLIYRLFVATLPSARAIEGGLQTSAFLDNLLPGRAVEFIAGMAVAAGIRFSVLLLPIAFLLRAFGPAWIGDPALGIGYAGLVSWLITKPAFAPRAAALGRASYSLFLVHVPVLELIARALPPGGPWFRIAVLLCVGGPACLCLAWTLYVAVELPAMRALKIRRWPAPQGQTSPAPSLW